MINFNIEEDNPMVNKNQNVDSQNDSMENDINDDKSNVEKESNETVNSSDNKTVEQEASTDQPVSNDDKIEDEVDKDIDADIIADNKDDRKEENNDSEILFPHLIGKKIGMTQLFSNDGVAYPATVIEVGPCEVTQIKDINKDGYNAIQLGYEDFKSKNKITKAYLGHFSKSDLEPKKFLKEFKVTTLNDEHNIGDVVTVKQFKVGDIVKITGTSKGKGFTGHMKRHGFSGGRKSHGKNSVMRKSGSVGAGSDPSRVFPGMKMAGRKGNYKRTIKNLSVLKIDVGNNTILVNGSVPGSNNSMIYLSKIL